MIELKCPQCNTVIEVTHNKDRVFCPKCIQNLNKQFVMLETSSQPYVNFGDGLFSPRKD